MSLKHAPHSWISQVGSIDTAPALRCERLRVRVLSVSMLSLKLNVSRIPLDKEITANCLVETRTKLEELIPAAMVKCGLWAD